MNFDFDCHVHTNFSYCADKEMSIDKIARLVSQNNLKSIVLTDHSSHFYFDEHRAWSYEYLKNPEMFYKVKAEGNKKIEKYIALTKPFRSDKIHLGIEADFMFNGELLLDQRLIEEFDLIIGSIHALPCIWGDYDIKIMKEEFIKYTKLLLNCPINILAHPTRIFERSGLKVPAEVIDPIIEEAVSKDIALELNSHSKNPADKFFIERCVKKGAKISIGTDSHSMKEIGNFSYHRRMLRKWPQALIFGEVLHCQANFRPLTSSPLGGED